MKNKVILPYSYVLLTAWFDLQVVLVWGGGIAVNHWWATMHHPLAVGTDVLQSSS